MISTNLFSNKFDTCNVNDFRYLLYLSQHDNYVNVAGKLYKISLNFETHQDLQACHHGPMIELTKETENELKLKLSKTTTSFIEIERGDFRPPFHSPLGEVWSNLKIDMLGIHCVLRIYSKNKFINLSIQIQNYDNLFCQLPIKAAQSDDIVLQKKLIDTFITQEQSLTVEALKHAIWKAAASGDEEQLTLLLRNELPFDLHKEQYKGKNIIDAMFDANLMLDVPFKSEKPNYEGTLRLLLNQDGNFNPNRVISFNNEKTFLDLCTPYQNKYFGFFKPTNVVHRALFKGIDSYINPKVKFENQNRVCLIS